MLARGPVSDLPATGKDAGQPGQRGSWSPLAGTGACGAGGGLAQGAWASPRPGSGVRGDGHGVRGRVV